jgi:hypothetical protein
MEKEVLKYEIDDAIYHENGNPQRNMIGSLTTLILRHWCGTEKEIAEKHSLILMNMKCRKMSHYEDFHQEWTQRIYEVKDIKNFLWTHVYLAALPSKFVEYLKAQEAFKLPYEIYTWGEIYTIVTNAWLVSVLT